MGSIARFSFNSRGEIVPNPTTLGTVDAGYRALADRIKRDLSPEALEAELVKQFGEVRASLIGEGERANIISRIRGKIVSSIEDDLKRIDEMAEPFRHEFDQALAQARIERVLAGVPSYNPADEKRFNRTLNYLRTVQFEIQVLNLYEQALVANDQTAVAAIESELEYKVAAGSDLARAIQKQVTERAKPAHEAVVGIEERVRGRAEYLSNARRVAAVMVGRVRAGMTPESTTIDRGVQVRV